MSEFECLFHKEINIESLEFEKSAKCVTVNRRRSDGRTILQVRIFVRENYRPTSVGVSLSSHQTRMLMELTENFIKMEEPNTWDEHLTPEGLHNLAADAWIGVAGGGKEVLLMRRNTEGLKGITLTAGEYTRLSQCLRAIAHIMFPAPCPKDVEIVESLGYELKRILNVIRYEECKGCEMDLANQQGHDCVLMDEETLVLRYFQKAVKGLNIPRVMTHVEYLHDLLKCGNPFPTIEEVKNYFNDCGWYVEHIRKKSSIEPLLTSFDVLNE